MTESTSSPTRSTSVAGPKTVVQKLLAARRRADRTRAGQPNRSSRMPARPGDDRSATPRAGTLSALLTWLPNFAGYAERDDRGRADAEQREWLADRLERGKQGLERYLRDLADDVQLGAVSQVDRLRLRTNQLCGRIRGAVRGGGGFFGGDETAAARLERVYEHDLALIEQVAETADLMESLGEASPPADVAERLDKIAANLAALSDAWDAREDLVRE